MDSRRADLPFTTRRRTTSRPGPLNSPHVTSRRPDTTSRFTSQHGTTRLDGPSRHRTATTDQNAPRRHDRTLRATTQQCSASGPSTTLCAPRHHSATNHYTTRPARYIARRHASSNRSNDERTSRHTSTASQHGAFTPRPEPGAPRPSASKHASPRHGTPRRHFATRRRTPTHDASRHGTSRRQHSAAHRITGHYTPRRHFAAKLVRTALLRYSTPRPNTTRHTSTALGGTSAHDGPHVGPGLGVTSLHGNNHYIPRRHFSPRQLTLHSTAT